MALTRQAKKGLLEGLIILVDQKIAYYSRERCHCEEDEEEKQRRRFLAEIQDGKKALEKLIKGLDQLAGYSNNEIQEGSIVSMSMKDDSEKQLNCFLVPYGAGQQLQLGDKSLLTVTSDSTLGKALLNRCAGNEVALASEEREIVFIIEQVD